MTKEEFPNYGTKLRMKVEWKIIDLELEYHLKLINKINEALELESTNLKNAYNDILHSDIDEEDKDFQLYRFDEEWEGFENYRLIYFNSLFVNVYTILENSLDKFCNKYCCNSSIFIKRKRKNESSISFYNRVIKQYIDVKNTELRAKMDLMDKTYRNIRNCLVHKRHKCTDKDIKNIRNFGGIEFRNNHYNTDLFEVIIENEKTITDFVREVRLLIKGIYDSFRKFE